MNNDKNCLLILAAGKGTRINCDGPKVLLEINGRPIIERLLHNVKDICRKPVLIISRQGEKLIDKFGGDCDFICQDKQLGTGHAVGCAKEVLEKEDYKNIVVLPGDHPGIKAETLDKLIDLRNQEDSVLAIASLGLENFDGLNQEFYHCGRIVRDNQENITDIVEFKDATDEQKNITEVNVSYYCFKADWLWQNIGKIENNNKAGEYYITDLVKIAKARGENISLIKINDITQGMGVNTVEQLKKLEKII